MSAPTLTGTLLVELDERTWKDQLDRTEQWFKNVRMVQATFRQMAEDTLEKVHEPHVREFLTGIVDTAQRHEDEADRLFEAIGRTPPLLRELMGEAMAKARAGLADLMGLAGGAGEPWRDLHQLYLVSLNAISAFGAAEQLGLALGLPEVVEIVLHVNPEKFAQHRQLEELALDFVPIAILYHDVQI